MDVFQRKYPDAQPFDASHPNDALAERARALVNAAPVIPAATRRALDDWLARGYAVEIGADGTLRVTPRAPQDDLDLIDFARKRK